MQKDFYSIETGMLLFFIAFSATFVIMSTGYGAKDAEFPVIASVVTGGLSVWELLSRWSKAKKGTLLPKKKLGPGEGGVKWVHSVFIIFGYFVTIQFAGLALATFGYTLVLEWLLGYRKRTGAVAVAVLVAAALILAMKYGLKMPVPGGILFGD
jgi:hypothetical protein